MQYAASMSDSSEERLWSCSSLCSAPYHRREDDRCTGINACIWSKQWCLYFRNHAKRYPFCGSRTDGSADVPWAFSFATTMRKIVIPQAVKNILPTLGNEFISLIKETSVVSFVGATDLYVAFNYIGSNSYEFMIPYLVMALIYIVMVLLISLGIKLMERSLRKSDRRH